MSILFVILFAGCAAFEEPPATPELSMDKSECAVDYGGKRYRANITNGAQGVVCVAFEYPEAVSSLVYTFGKDGCTIRFGDLSCECGKSRLGSSALPQLIAEILKNACARDALTYDGTSGGVSSFHGTLDGFRYTVRSDARTGEIAEITSKALGIEARFVE